MKLGRRSIGKIDAPVLTKRGIGGGSAVAAETLVRIEERLDNHVDITR